MEKLITKICLFNISNEKHTHCFSNEHPKILNINVTYLEDEFEV